MYGPAFKPPIPADAMVARNLKDPYPKDVPDGPAVHRRSVYLFHKRVIPYPLFQAFDAPDAQQCTGRRNVTTVAPQALALLNDPFVRARAGDFADRLLRGGRRRPGPRRSTGPTGWRSAGRRRTPSATPGSSSSPSRTGSARPATRRRRTTSGGWP